MIQRNRPSYNVAIAGAGIVGLTIARALQRHGFGQIALFDKERQLGQHASGRNSGVIHCGIYYPAGSLKAQLCAKGAELLKEYAREHSIRLVECGKVIVAPREKHLATLAELQRRAEANGIPAHKITPRELGELEPLARTTEAALFCPSTAIIDSPRVLETLSQELDRSQVPIHLGEEIRSFDPHAQLLRTSQAEYSVGHFINCAGLHADSLAHQMGVARNYQILPFKGLYRKLRGNVSKVQRCVYPAPDLQFPFLGVHVTPGVHGDVYLGPTAIPALGRENYTWSRGVSGKDLKNITLYLAAMALQNTDHIRSYMFSELFNLRKSSFLKAVQELVPSIASSDIEVGYSKCGIRAQLINTVSERFEMDFVVEPGERSTHILNTVSPGFTSSFAFAEMIIAQYLSGKGIG